MTPLTAIALGEIACEVGFPPGVFNVITGGGSTVGQALVEHPGVDKIAFYGRHEHRQRHSTCAPLPIRAEESDP